MKAGSFTIMDTNKQIDYIIIGQGLCGTWLSYYFLKAGKSVLVVDQLNPFTASKVASGIINPVTGRRIVRTWRIEELLPFAIDAYTVFGKTIGAKLISSTSILDFHPTLQMKEAFDKRVAEETTYLHTHADEQQWTSLFNFPYSIGKIAPCLLVDINTMMEKWRINLIGKNALLEERFSWNDCAVFEDHVTYKNITAKKVFCCDGVDGFNNPYFYQLPYSHMKGEALIVSIPGLPASHIYKHGLSIVPWKDDLFWVGSSYEWKFENLEPTEIFRKKTEAFLQQFLKLPFTVVKHFAADRPANMERRPFAGLHPQKKAVGILNGMGTKGCSLAPFFANQLVNNILHSTPIYADADVQRHERILQRNIK